MCGCFGFRPDLCGLGLRGRCRLRFAPGLGGLELRASFGLRLEPRGLGLRRGFGLRLPAALGRQERGSSRELHLAPGLGRLGLGLRSAPGLRCFCGSDRYRLCMEPGGFRLRRGLGLGPEPGSFGLRLDPRSLGHRFSFGLGFDLGLDPGRLGRLGLRLDPCRLGQGFCLGRSGRLGLRLDPCGVRRGFGFCRGLDLGPEPRLDVGFDGVDRRGRSSHAEPSKAGHDVDVPRIIGRRGLDCGCWDRGIFVRDVRGRPGQRVERRDVLATILDGGVPVGVGHDRATGEVEIGEGGGEHLVAEERSARQAATLGRVPAVAARVLPARHAEVEGLVERVELLRRDLAVGLVARRSEGLVHGGVVGQDEVLETARQDSHTLEAGDPRNRGLERVAGAAPFAE